MHTGRWKNITKEDIPEIFFISFWTLSQNSQRVSHWLNLYAEMEDALAANGSVIQASIECSISEMNMVGNT